MERIPKPVISCTIQHGHEGIISELESKLMQHISSQNAFWTHSKRVLDYSFPIEAEFTRYVPLESNAPVKVLSSGRPVYPLGASRPLLYIHVVTNNVTQYNNGTMKQSIGVWLADLAAQNINDWVILMIDRDPQWNVTPKLLQKTNVIQLIQQDFNVPTVGIHFLELTDRRTVDEKTFQTSWSTLMRTLRKIICGVYHRTIEDYEAHLNLLEKAQSAPGWEFFEYLNRKEELAQLYMSVHGFEDALQEYYSLESLFAQSIQSIRNESDTSTYPSWINALRQKNLVSAKGVHSFLSHFPIVAADTSCRQFHAIRDRVASLFDLRTYMLARQRNLLVHLGRLDEFFARAISSISSTICEATILKLHVHPSMLHCWAFICALNCLEVRQKRRSGKTSNITSPTRFAYSPRHSCDAMSLKNVDPTSPFSPFALQTAPLLSNASFVFGDPGVFPNTETPQSVDNVSVGSRQQHSNHFLVVINELATDLYGQLSAAVNVVPKTATIGMLAKCQVPRMIELWLLAFMHLTRLGQRLTMWSTDPMSEAALKAIADVEVSVSMCALSELTDLGTFARSVHKFLPSLLTPRTNYAEIYVNFVQISLGFLYILDQPRRSISIWFMLAEYFNQTDSTSKILDIFSMIMSYHSRENWPELRAFAFLYLACCLHPHVNCPEVVSPSSERFLRRYFHCCLALSCASSHLLSSLIPLLSTHRTELFLAAAPPAITLEHVKSPDFWWSEAIRCQTLLPTHSAWDSTSALSPPFRVNSISLKGANRYGFQRISLHIHSAFLFPVVVHLFLVAKPLDMNQWQTLLKHDCIAEKTDKSIGVSDLEVVDLRRETSASWLPRSVAHLNIPNTVHARHPASRIEQLRIDDVLPDSGSEERRQSILEIAASLANRSVWRSQDTLSMSLPVSERKTPDFREVKLKKDSITEGPVSSPPLSAVPPTPREREANGFFLKLCDPTTDFSTANRYTPEHGGYGFVLQPGLNRINMVAENSGFTIPVQMCIDILDRFTLDREGSDAVSEKDPIFRFTETIQTDQHQLDHTWSNRGILDRLLPKLHLQSSDSAPQGPKSIRVILGLRQKFRVEIELGDLNMPSTSDCLGVFRTTSTKRKSHGISTSTPFLINDYLVSPCMGKLPYLPMEMGENSPFIEIHDGPIHLQHALHESDRQSNHFPRHTRLKLMEPLVVRALTDDDQFFLSMPSGHMSELPVEIIRPLALTLKVLCQKPSNIVFFVVRIACLDIPEQENPLRIDDASGEAYLPSTQPLTFKLTNFTFMVRSPSTDSEPAHQVRSNSILPTTVRLPQGFVPRQQSLINLKALKQGHSPLVVHNSKTNTLIADPVDPSFDKLFVNRLCPGTLLFRLKFSEFNNFVTSAVERTMESPVSHFLCNYSLVHEPEIMYQLQFNRRISPNRVRSGSMGNMRTRKDRSVR